MDSGRCSSHWRLFDVICIRDGIQINIPVGGLQHIEYMYNMYIYIHYMFYFAGRCYIFVIYVIYFYIQDPTQLAWFRKGLSPKRLSIQDGEVVQFYS